MNANNYLESKVIQLELEIERLQTKQEIQDQKLAEYGPIIEVYGNRNIFIKLIGVITVLNLLLLLFK